MSSAFPRDFAAYEATVGGIISTIAGGLGYQGAELVPSVGSWASKLKESEIRAIIEQIKVIFEQKKK